ncbi:MAG: hypothetical protein V1907_02160 [Candidatus Kerfeldbacteria bacterium]
MVYTRTETKKEHLDFWKRLKISELGFRIVLVAVIVAGGFGYLVMTSTTSTRGLEVKELSDRLETLSSQRSTLQAAVDRLQSLSRLETARQGLDLVQVENVQYLTTSGAVAAR